MQNPWPTEIGRFFLILFIALLVGAMVDRHGAVLFIATLFYLGWHFYHLVRLEDWLSTGGMAQPPTGSGVWGEIYYHFSRLQQRSRARKRRLAAYLSRFREMSSVMPDAVVVLRHDGLIDWFNDAAIRLLGLRAAQDIGHPLTNLVRHPTFISFLSGKYYAEPVEFPSPVNANIILSVTLIPYGDDQLLLIARDVTRVHHLEKMRRDFVANVSHELRTPITVIGGFLETMGESDEGHPPEWRRSLQLMQQQTLRMQHIVDDLLLLARLETDKRLHVDDIVAVPLILETLKSEATILSGDQHHDISLEVESGLYLKGNEGELRSAFSNLVTNAVRYTPAHGHIRLRWYSDVDGAHFLVQDSGIGIAPLHLPRLTERFYRVDAARSRQTGGTGLGLAIVKHVLEHHQGQLTIDSQLGEGSTFTCHFPPALIVRK